MAQDECEAFMDAIVYTMMIDKVVDPDEMEKVEALADQLPWVPPGGAAAHVRTAMSRALEYGHFQTQAEPYLMGLAAGFRSAEARVYTRKACLKVIAADGEESRTEAALGEILNRVFR